MVPPRQANIAPAGDPGVGTPTTDSACWRFRLASAVRRRHYVPDYSIGCSPSCPKRKIIFGERGSMTRTISTPRLRKSVFSDIALYRTRPSFNDDRVRRQVARAVFGDARLSTYSIQLVPPIHIIVKNGHGNLDGVVRTQTDRDTAFHRRQRRRRRVLRGQQFAGRTGGTGISGQLLSQSQ